LLEKSKFPREKVCGDGLTPRGAGGLIRLGIDTSQEAGWLHNKGLRIYGGERPFELEWPVLSDFPGYGLVRPRADLDELLARHAVTAGASLYELSNVIEPIIDSRSSRIVGVRTKDGRSFTAPMVVAADGNSTRLSLAMGLNRRADRPMGVAVRTYYTSPRHRDDYWNRGWNCGRGNQARARCYPAMGGSSAWAMVPAMSGWAS
jgi:flavin-dependent dehydrogenase